MLSNNVVLVWLNISDKQNRSSGQTKNEEMGFGGKKSGGGNDNDGINMGVRNTRNSKKK